MADLRTYIGKTTRLSVRLVAERVDATRVRVKAVNTQGVTVTSVVMTYAEAAKLATDLGALAPVVVTPPPVSAAWAWDAKNAPLDPDVSLAGRFAANVKTPNLAMLAYGVATASATVDTQPVSFPTSHSGTMSFRIPLGARPTAGSDRHLTVRDPVTGNQIDLWQANYDATTRKIIGASSGRIFPIGAVNYPRGWGGCAACTPLRAGLVTPEDMTAAIAANGALPYTLQFGIPNIPDGLPRYPATANVPTNLRNSVWEGTWVRLDPALNADALALKSWEKVIARTLQLRGMVCRDNSGTLAVYAENPQNRGGTWSPAGLSGDSALFSPAFPWGSVQVLSPPSG